MINVVHAFTGVDAQYMAEKKVWREENINVIGSMEVDPDAIISCALIHENEKFHLHLAKDWTDEDYINAREWLRKRNIGFDFNTNKSKLDRMKKDKLKQLYVASVCIKNFGDISLANKVKLKNDVDIFTYSFPCVDVSIVGKQEGLIDGSKSSLLWECEQFIVNNKPKVLVMENVKNLIGKRFKKDFDKWLDILNKLGYNSYYKVLNAKDYGIPQNRERVFCVSIRKDIDYKFEFKKEQQLNTTLKMLLETNAEDKYTLKETASFFIRNSFDMERKGNGFRFKPHVLNNANISKCITTRAGGRMDDNFILDIGSKGEVFEFSSRNNELNRFDENLHKIRKLTPRECWRLMGFSDNDFDKVKDYISDCQLYKQAGNSIVVNCLESIFEGLKDLFKEEV